MSILNRLFGAPRTSSEILADAEARLEEARGFALTAPREGLKVLRYFSSGDLEGVVDFGGPLHSRFAQTVTLVLDAASRSASPTILPACTVHSDPPFDARDEIESIAKSSDEGVVYMRFPARWDGHRLALAGIEALWMFARDPSIAVLYLGQDYAIYRNPVFVDAVEHLKADLESGAMSLGLNDVLRDDLGLEEVPDLVTPCGFEVFGYRFKGAAPE